MPITIQGTGTKIKPIFQGETLPANTLVPSKRAAVEALGTIERLTRTHDDAVLIDGEPVTWTESIDILRRYILTR